MNTAIGLNLSPQNATLRIFATEQPAAAHRIVREAPNARAFIGGNGGARASTVNLSPESFAFNTADLFKTAPSAKAF